MIPEVETDPEAVAGDLRAAYERGKAHAIVVVAEGARFHPMEPGQDESPGSPRKGAEGLARYFQDHQQRLGFSLRMTTLGHVQRGGAPGAFDRLLATRLGAAATERLARGARGLLMGLRGGEITATLLVDVVAKEKPLDLELLELAHVLAK